MKKLSCKEIRERWIDFFTNKCSSKHQLIKSASLVPDNPTLLLNSAGMVQFVPIFIGNKTAPQPPRAITIQKCARVGGKDSDLENIGRTNRHHSFFEMLGNFSFGDYFKEEVIPWAWQFVTQELELDPQRLYISVFAGDETNPFDSEAYNLWSKVLSKDFEEPSKRIWKMERKDNFWGPPGNAGPCGPCSEIYYDLGSHITNKDDRYIEIWNLVFMEFEKDETGSYKSLAKKNIDTGAGLERIATILQGVNNSFETDELFDMLSNLSSNLGIEYKGSKAVTDCDSRNDIYLKIITDHVRCLSFLIADGVRPSNLGRGYVLRMLIRRAARFAYLLRMGSVEPILYRITDTVVKNYAYQYPELQSHAQQIKDTCKKEEEAFAKTINNGINILEEELKRNSKVLSGDFVFNLYATYGFPIELTQDIISERGVSIDYEAYEIAKEKHSQASNTGTFNTAIKSMTAIQDIANKYGITKFIGYEELTCEAKIIAILDNNFEPIDSSDGDVFIVLDQTPFYAESGGQLADKGIINNIEVLDVKNFEGIYLHKVSGQNLFKNLPDTRTGLAQVDPEKRNLTRYHHTSCHLLQAALRKLFGVQVQQMGSQVGSEQTRFDFNLDRAMTKEEIKTVENQINDWIQAKLPVHTEVMNFDEAVKAGALSFFEEKYGDKVRVLSIKNDALTASIELCGGTHVSNTSEIGQIIIAQEGSVASGIRRIKLLANTVAKSFIEEREAKARATELEQIQLAQAKESEKKRIEELSKHVLSESHKLLSKIQAKDKIDVLIANLSEFYDDPLEADIIRTLIENLLAKIESNQHKGFVFLASSNNDKVIFFAIASESLVKDKNSPYNASNAVKLAAQICGGNGGGRPNFAQAGGKDPSKIQEALATISSSLFC